MHITMLIYPGLTQLDLTGPFEVFARVPGVTIDLVWKDLEPLRCGSGLTLTPTATFADCQRTDVLFVPGGPGQLALMYDDTVLAFLRERAEKAQYVTSVCTGSLVLAAAGLLMGYRATCHWLSLDQLALMGADPVAERVVTDRNRITGAGVTSGIDFALAFVARVFGEDRARIIQLGMEYDPAPPLSGGSPKTAQRADVEAIIESAAPFQQRREEAARKAGARLGAR
ncbi:DJ-1/PfpI family protein [Devosia sp. WQ 349]|uniref:DJ-1/PfpI family protein n=1 Tax=Devosia sp. WQ 349K1 TaxID=2800329 RepID=UPI001905F5AC|nr:DJ-1/PfpI family protein [Devosia sp. WQ 349K1]MBK1794035.1 DJ-1/PfpI family protein [Devosia sp. WQ 349K1]